MNRRSIAYCLSVFTLSLGPFGLLGTQGYLGTPGYGNEPDADNDAKSAWVTSIASLGTSGQFVAGTADGLLLREATVYSFAATNPAEFHQLYTHPAAVWRVDASSDGSTVASVDYRGNLIVFDTASSKPTMHEKAFERWCQAMILTPDDKSILAGNEAGKIMLWDLAAGKVSASAELDAHAITGLAVSPDGTQVAATDGGGHVHLLSLPDLKETGKIEASKETAWCVAYVEDGTHLLVGSSDRHLYRCQAEGDAKAESIAKGSDWITQIAVSSDGQVAASEIGGRLHFPSSGGVDSMDADSGVWSLCWNGSAQLLAGTRKDGIVVAGRSWKWTQPSPPKASDDDDEDEEEDDDDDDDDEDDDDEDGDEADDDDKESDDDAEKQE